MNCVVEISKLVGEIRLYKEVLKPFVLCHFHE